jgi:PAS domain S-box-containing protein
VNWAWSPRSLAAARLTILTAALIGALSIAVPAGSAILYSPPGIWELHRGYLVGGVLILGLQTSLIIALMIHRTRGRRTELALLESQRRYTLATGAASLGVWDWNFETGELYVDPVLKSLLGFADAEISSRPEDWGARVHPQDVPAAAARIKACIDGDSEVYDIEHRMVHKDGSVKWFLSRGSAMRRADGSLQRLVGTKVDITERKRAEETIRESEAALQVSHREIQRLAGRLIEAQDAERARVARDLHDDVSQQLAALSIGFSGLNHRVAGLPGSADAQRDLRALHQRTLTLTETVRHLSYDLHPTVLQHVGLMAALTEYCAELSHPDLAMTCTAEGDFEGLAPEAALCFYRIAQEALRNVVAHAGASVATVHLRRIGEIVELSIADDGRGFALAGSHRSGKGLGLVSITERVRLAGGTLSVVSELNKGTRLRAQIPVSAPATPGV